MTITELRPVRPLDVYNQRFRDPATYVQTIGDDQYVPLRRIAPNLPDFLRRHVEPTIVAAYDNLIPYTHLVRFADEHPGTEYYLARIENPNDRHEVKRIRFFMDARNADHEKVYEFGPEKIYYEPLRFSKLDAMNRNAVVGQHPDESHLVPVDLDVHLDRLTDAGRVLAETITTTINRGPGSVLMRSTITNHERRLRLAQDTPERIESIRIMFAEDNTYDVRPIHWTAYNDAGTPESYLNSFASFTVADDYRIEVQRP